MAQHTREPIYDNDGKVVADTALAHLQGQHQFVLNLFQMAAKLAAYQTLSELTEQTVRLLVDTMNGVDGAAFWLWVPEEDRLRLAALHSAPELTILEPDAMRSLAPRLHESYVGEAVVSGQPIVLPDAAAFVHSLQTLATTDIATLRDDLAKIPPSLRVTCLPLRVGAYPVGAIDLYTTGLQPELVLADLPVLQIFADQLAGMVLTVRRYVDLQFQCRKLEAFGEVARAISDAADIKQLLERALDSTRRVTATEHGLISLIEDKVAYIEITHNLPQDIWPAGAAWDVAETVFATVVETGQPEVQVVHDDHPWAVLRSSGVEMVALLPLFSRGEVIGVLTIGGDADLSNRLDWPSLIPIGAHIGTATVHYQLYGVIQRERRRLATLIDSIVEGVLLCDSAGELLLFNQAATTLLNCSLMPGMPLDELASGLRMRTLDRESLPSDLMPLARGLQGEVVRDDELIVSGSADEDIVINCSVAPLHAQDGMVDGAVMVFRDVTAHKHYDAIRDEFLAVAAHELRAPLAAIKGYSDLLVKREIERPDATERDRKGSVMLSRQIDHLVRLVDNLLDVSRIDTGRLELYLQSVDLIVLLETCVDRISVGGPNHQFMFDGPPTLEIVCDQLRIQQVFTNLLANAARYSPPGTEVRVKVWTESCHIEEETVVDWEGSDTCVVVEVHDQGVGIPMETHEQVFERYYRANTTLAASGLGLGLYLCREIVARHGGKIWLKSEPDFGTSFFVALPLSLKRTVAASGNGA
jgi:two-component system phosphate regulon sensor histidine kinase PhoR